MKKLYKQLEGENYEIKFQGHLDQSWYDWCEGLTFTYGNDGTTTFRGEGIDQAALHGLLKRIRDLGLPLISVNRIDPDLLTKKD